MKILKKLTDYCKDNAMLMGFAVISSSMSLYSGYKFDKLNMPLSILAIQAILITGYLLGNFLFKNTNS